MNGKSALAGALDHQLSRRSESSTAPGHEHPALANARLAVELDQMRRADRIQDARLAAAVVLAPRVETAEALLLGIPVPASRLDCGWTKALNLAGRVVLDEEVAFRVIGNGPLSETSRPDAVRLGELMSQATRGRMR